MDKTPIVLEKEVKISGIYIQDTNFAANGIAILNNDTFQSIYKEKGIDLETSTLLAMANSEENVEKIKSDIKEIGFKATDTSEIMKTLNDMLSVITSVFVGISGISLVVSAVMILVVMYISVIERIKEIGVLRAIGARKIDVKRIFLCEASLIGFFSGLVAIICALGIQIVGNKILLNLLNLEIIKITPQYLLTGMIISIVISTISGYLPASKASKMDPVESLRTE